MIPVLQGRFEIISLSGSFLFSENSGGQLRTGGLSVSLAGSDGRVLGGGVAGLLMAATPVQVYTLSCALVSSSFCLCLMCVHVKSVPCLCILAFLDLYSKFLFTM